MKIIWTLGAAVMLFLSSQPLKAIPETYQHVDMVIWVVSNAEQTVKHYTELGFTQVVDLGKVSAESESTGERQNIRLICANLGGAHVAWIEPKKGHSLFNEFLQKKGEGAMSLVHRFSGKQELIQEENRLNDLGIKTLDRISIETARGDLTFVLMDTREEGKFTLGFIAGGGGTNIFDALRPENRNVLKLNQYAFAIRDPGPVSAFWHQIGLPEFRINHPVLGETHYYGKIVDHELIQGWQRHGDIAYEWCIPVKPPIVYEDHIQLHGEGIHHLAFSVPDMDLVLDDYRSRGYVVSMGGTWGEKGKPGSGRYEYIDLNEAGGLTMELLWNYSE